jgi:CYTH domain-containing protein
MLRVVKVVEEEEEVQKINMMDWLGRKVQDVTSVSIYSTTIIRISLKH